MERRQNVEFRVPPGAVSPLVLDTFTRYALPEMAQHSPYFIATDPRQRVEVGFGSVIEDDNTSRYVLTLRDLVQSDLPGDQGRPKQKVFHFNQGKTQTYKIDADDAGQGFAQQQLLGVDPSYCAQFQQEERMQQTDLEKILGVWLDAGLLRGRTQALLSMIQETKYVPFTAEQGDQAEYDRLTLASAQYYLNSAVQIMAADDPKEYGVRNRERCEDLDSKTTRQDCCSLNVEVLDSGNDSEVMMFFASSTRQDCNADAILPDSLEHLSRLLQAQYPTETTRHQCREFIEEACRDAAVYYQNDVSYSFRVNDTSLNRTSSEHYVIMGAITDTMDLDTEHTLTLGQTQEDFVDQNTLTQRHVEEMTALLTRLDLLLRPTRWG